MAYPDFLLDKRVAHRNIAKGLLTKKTLDDHLESLPDMEANAEVCEPDPPATEENAAAEGETAEASGEAPPSPAEG